VDPSLKSLVKNARAAAEKKTALPSPQPQGDLISRSVSFTPAVLSTVEDFVKKLRRPGNGVNRSGVLRAMIRFAERHATTEELAALVDNERESGEVKWGRKA
jgi:hypothetical protein